MISRRATCGGSPSATRLGGEPGEKQVAREFCGEFKQTQHQFRRVRGILRRHVFEEFSRKRTLLCGCDEGLGKIGSIYEGTSNMQMATIAKNLMK